MKEALKPAESKCTAEQAIQWAKKLQDGLNEPVDPVILTAVAGLHMQGIETRQSCQGHLDWGEPFPWIDILPSSREAFLELLEVVPLPGFALSKNRLIPLKAAPFNPFSPFTVEAIPLHNNPLTRPYLLKSLPAHQAQISAWGEQLLSNP